METEKPNSAWLDEIRDSTTSLDLAAQFSNMHLWSSPEENTQATKAFLSLHGRNYFSPLRASFLFEHSSEASLSHFSPLLARDGALDLLHFFSRKNVIPNSKFLIPEELTQLVPSPWRGQCLGYRYNQVHSSAQKVTKLLFVVSALGGKHCDEEQLQGLLEKYLGLLNIQNMQIFVSFVMPNVPDTFEQINGHATKALEQVLFIERQFSKRIHSIAFEDLLGKHLEEWAFLDVNPLKFYYSDSYIHHSLMSRGALNLESKWVTHPEGICLSPFHGISFSELQASKIDGEIARFKSNPLLWDEEKFHRPKRILFNTKICSASWEDFVYDLVRRP